MSQNFPHIDNVMFKYKIEIGFYFLFTLSVQPGLFWF